MTAQSSTTNKANFEQGDVPTGSQFADLIDSSVNKVDTTAQTMASNLLVPGIVATIVSANSGYYNVLRVASPTGGFYAASANIDVAFILQAQIDNLSATIVSATTIDAARVSAAAVAATVVSADTIVCSGLAATTVSAVAVRATTVTASSLWLDTSFTWNGETTVRASVGTATTPMPLTAQGFIVATVNGVSVRIPYFRG